MPNSITPPPHLLKKFSTEARDESNKRNGAGYLKTFARLCIEWANSKSTSNDRQIRSSEITPPPELVQQWTSFACEEEDGESWNSIATQAAQWGADTELEACCQALYSRYVNTGLLPATAETVSQEMRDWLRSARRPEPPSLKEQALEQLREVNAMLQFQTTGGETSAIRRALEALPND
jgi:hypothetical protein